MAKRHPHRATNQIKTHFLRILQQECVCGHMEAGLISAPLIPWVLCWALTISDSLAYSEQENIKFQTLLRIIMWVKSWPLWKKFPNVSVFLNQVRSLPKQEVSSHCPLETQLKKTSCRILIRPFVQRSLPCQHKKPWQRRVKRLKILFHWRLILLPSDCCVACCCHSPCLQRIIPHSRRARLDKADIIAQRGTASASLCQDSTNEMIQELVAKGFGSFVLFL